MKQISHALIDLRRPATNAWLRFERSNRVMRYTFHIISDSVTGIDERGLNTSKSSKILLNEVTILLIVPCACVTSYFFA